MPKRQHHRIPIDASRWSSASQRSMSSISPTGQYEDIHYDCIACRAPSTFSAEAQKDAFEARKAYIWQRRVLCDACFETRWSCERELRAIRSRWRASRAEARRDAAMLRRWLELMVLLPTYGARRDVAAIAMVKKALSDRGASVDAASPPAGLRNGSSARSTT